jgi:hypothetical protein
MFISSLLFGFCALQIAISFSWTRSCAIFLAGQGEKISLKINPKLAYGFAIGFAGMMYSIFS